MDITLHTTNLKQFRTSLYQNFNNRADSLMDLLDAMCSVPHAKSVVEYSLAACYRGATQRSSRRSMRWIWRMWLAYQLSPICLAKEVAILAADGGCDARSYGPMPIRWKIEAWSISRRW